MSGKHLVGAWHSTDVPYREAAVSIIKCVDDLMMSELKICFVMVVNSVSLWTSLCCFCEIPGKQ